MCPRGAPFMRLCQGTTPAHQSDEEQYDGDDQQHMEHEADRKRPDETQQPGDEENDGDGVRRAL